MITHPTAEELVAAVGRWIDEVRPQLDPRNAFLGRVAQNALALVGRELAQGVQADAAAAERLAGVLGHGGAYADLAHELCAALRRGEVDAATPGLLAALKANALDQLAIDQPRYKHDPAG
ncbi:MAG: hypothetical protein JWQ97_3647 [Phenylobacterium sp.]|nr:hypothetical protein [Phenylobacterium sp.]